MINSSMIASACYTLLVIMTVLYQKGQYALKLRIWAGLLTLSMVIAGCTLETTPAPSNNNDGSSNTNSSGVISQQPASGETGVVTNIIDGDTIDVAIGGVEQRVRYVGVNTPERDEPCYGDARDVNANLVRGQTVTLVRDVSDTDQYGRLLRYVYVGDTFVNATLVAQGWAEAVEYRPDTGQTAYFRDLEEAATAANLGCHSTGIFNDGTMTR